MSVIGLEFLLHKVSHPHMSDDRDEFVRVEIVETRKVAGNWGGPAKKYDGWKAKGEDGKTYYCNWKSFPDSSMTPNYMWRSEDGQFWYNITYVREVQFRPSWLEEYGDLIKWCPDHLNLSYIRDRGENDPFDGEPCMDCSFDKEPRKDQKWVGWR